MVKLLATGASGATLIAINHSVLSPLCRVLGMCMSTLLLHYRSQASASAVMEGQVQVQ
jgi:hypothetical protein